MNKDEQVARAFIAIATCDNYMVGFVNIVEKDTLEKARQILIHWSNQKDNKDPILETAIDLIEREIKGVAL